MVVALRYHSLWSFVLKVRIKEACHDRSRTTDTRTPWTDTHHTLAHTPHTHCTHTPCTTIHTHTPNAKYANPHTKNKAKTCVRLFHNSRKFRFHNKKGQCAAPRDIRTFSTIYRVSAKFTSTLFSGTQLQSSHAPELQCSHPIHHPFGSINISFSGALKSSHLKIPTCRFF